MLQPTAQTICEDVLYLIFLYTLPVMFEGDGSGIDITTREPMNLYMVCQSWRAVVVSHPNLWANIQFMNDTFTPTGDSLHHFLVKWLEYSQASPLNIWYELCRLGFREESDKVLTDIMDTTVSQYRRFYDVDIYMEDPEVPFTLQMSPSLVSLILTLYWHDRQVPSKFASLDFDPCPVSAMLRTLCVSEGVQWILPKTPAPILTFSQSKQTQHLH